MNKRDDMSTITSANQSVRVLLALLNLPGMGRRTAHRLVATQQSIDSLESILKEHRSSYTPEQIKSAYDHADNTLKRSKQEDIHILSFLDPDFPLQLKSIEDPPLLLHVKGNLHALASRWIVAIIGTREPTSFGAQSGRRIAATVAHKCFVVVSGLAKGCDTAAHWGCIDAKGQTVAVLAHGLDKIYPAENKSLAQEILDTDGCLVSEYEIGQRAFKTSFIDRDRLQSGLSQAVILIETDIKGGSMHTVRFAQQQHRILACVKHPPHLASEDKVQGNLKLLSEGVAMPLASAEDVEALMERLHRSNEPLEPLKPASDLPPAQMSMF